MGYRGPGPLGTDYNNPVIDPGTLVLDESLPPGPLGTQPMPAYRDEITPIASYIAGEMNRNAHSPFVKFLARLNSFPPDACIENFSDLTPQEQLLIGIEPAQCVGMQQIPYRELAMFLWAMKVRPRANWDHKSDIKARFPSRATGRRNEHLYGNHLYNHDIWSNIHYGYVGMAAGFPGSVLVKGAGIAHFLSNPKLPEGWRVDDLKTWDDPRDRAAIKLGIWLYRSRPRVVTTQDVMSQVRLSPISLRARLYRP